MLNRRIGVWGAAFKPLTDDVRDSPALNVAAPAPARRPGDACTTREAGDAARRTFPTLSYVTSMEDAAEGADVLLVLTEWDEFVAADPTGDREGGCIDLPSSTVAGASNRDDWRAAGWDYRGLGIAA